MFLISFENRLQKEETWTKRQKQSGLWWNSIIRPYKTKYYFYLNSGQTADESNKSNKKRVTASPSLRWAYGLRLQTLVSILK